MVRVETVLVIAMGSNGSGLTESDQATGLQELKLPVVQIVKNRCILLAGRDRPYARWEAAVAGPAVFAEGRRAESADCSAVETREDSDKSFRCLLRRLGGASRCPSLIAYRRIWDMVASSTSDRDR